MQLPVARASPGAYEEWTDFHCVFFHSVIALQSINYLSLKIIIITQSTSNIYKTSTCIFYIILNQVRNRNILLLYFASNCNFQTDHFLHFT